MMTAKPVFGQDAARDSFFDLSLEELLEIKVTSAARYPQSLLESPNAVWVISAEDIRHSGVRSLAEAVALAPGAFVIQDEGDRWIVTLGGFTPEDVTGFANIRDGSNRLLVLVDGMTVYSSLFGNVEWDSIPVSLGEIQRVEVIRGSGGLIYGANAIDGVIHIFTRHADEKNRDYLSMKTGNQGIRSTASGFETSSASGGLKARISAAFEEDNGLGRDGGEEHFDYERLLSLSINTEVKLAEDTNLELNSRAKRGEIGFPGAPPFVPAAHRESLHRLTQLKLTHEGDSGGRTELQLYERNRSIEEETAGAGEQYKIDRNQDLEFRHIRNLGSPGRHIISIGGGARQSRMEHILILDGEQHYDTRNLYINDELKLGDKWTMHSGVKWEKDENTEATWPWRVALNYQLDKKQAVRVAVARAYRSPTLLELFQETISPGAVVLGHPDLVPESSDIYELEYRGAVSDRFLLNILVSQKNHEDLICNYNIPATTDFSYINDGEAVRRSIDVGLDGQVSRHIGTSLFFSRNDVKIEGNYAQAYYTAPPENLARLAIYYTTGSLRADLGFRYQDETIYMDDYLRMDARLERTFPMASGRSLNLILSGQNLLEDYHEEGGFEIPRTYSAAIEMSL